MDYSLFHPNSIISGEINLPSSKSLSNRALIIRALSNSFFDIINLSQANDTTILKNALQTKSRKINVEDAGTAFRFLTSYLSVTEGEYILSGSQRMKQRPIGDLVDGLRKLGAKIEYLEKINRPPLKITGTNIEGGEITVNGSVSSQFISSLLMIAPTLKKGLILKIKGEIVSKPYIEMTLKMLHYFGIENNWKGNTITISKQEFKLQNITIESDWSAAAFWLEIISLSKQGNIELKGLFNNSWQGDCLSPRFFEKLNVRTHFKGDSLIIKKEEKKNLDDSIINLLDLPDLSLSLICSYAFNKKHGKFIGLQTLKNKESDRLESLSNELKKYGIICNYDNSSLTIESCKGKIEKLKFNTYKDHRIAMSLAPLALKEKIVIYDVDVVKKSYPNFWKDLQSAGFTITALTH